MADIFWMHMFPGDAHHRALTHVDSVIYQQWQHQKFFFPGYRLGPEVSTLILTANGSSDIWHGSQMVRAQRGSLTLLLPGEDHRFHMAYWETHAAHFQPSAHLRHLLTTLVRSGGHTWHEMFGADLLESWHEIFGYPDTDATIAAYRASVLVEFTLLTLVRRSTSSQPRPAGMRLYDIAQYLQRHPACSLSVTELAAMASLSRSHFTLRFQQEFGEPVHAYRIRLRIERAKALLDTTGLSISEIGSEVGYPDPHHFYAVFKRQTGVAPGFYRTRSGAYPPFSREQ